MASTSQSGYLNVLVLKHQGILMLLSPDALAFLFPSGWVSILTSDPLRNIRPFRGLLSDYSYMVYPMCQLNSSCEIPPCPSMICTIIDNLPWLLANTTWSCISCSVFPWESYTRDTCVSSLFPFHWSDSSDNHISLLLVCLTFLVIWKYLSSDDSLLM